MASMAGLGEQSDFIIEEFAKCWQYLGQCGMMAKEMVVLLEGQSNSNMEEDIVMKRAQLNRILSVMESIAEIKTREKNSGGKKCNLYNRGFCSNGLDCNFYHPQQLCESFESYGVCEVRKCSKRHLYSCRFFNSRSGCGRGKSCHFSHRQVRKLEDEKDGDIDKEREVTLNNEENKCGDSDGLRKGRLGEGNFGWIPRGMGKHVCESEIFPIKDQQQESDSREIDEEKDLYDELIDAMNEGNDQLTDEMMDRILDRFEAVGDEKKKGKGKRVEAKKTKKKVGSAMRGKCRGRGKKSQELRLIHIVK